MKHSSTFTSFLAVIVAVLLFTIASMLMSSCSGVRYTYFNKQKVPYTVSEETELAKTIPAKPFLIQSEKELKEKASASQNNRNEQKNEAKSAEQKKPISPATLERMLKEISVAKYISKKDKDIQSEDNTNNDDRTLMIVLLVVLILVLISLLGNDLLWLLFVALLVFLIYYLIVYLDIFH